MGRENYNGWTHINARYNYQFCQMFQLLNPDNAAAFEEERELL